MGKVNQFNMGGDDGHHALFSLLKLDNLRMDENEVCARLPYQRRFSEGLSHGLAHGWTTIAIDTLLGMAVYSSLKQPCPIATIDLNIDFMRQTYVGADIMCRAVCDEIVDGIAFMRGELSIAGTKAKIANVSAKFAIKNSKASRAAVKANLASPISSKMPDGLPCQHFESRKADMPYLRWLDPAYYSNGEGNFCVLLFNETQIGDPRARAIHGGILASLMEVAAFEEITKKTEQLIPYRLISQSAEFFRPTKPQHMFSSAKIIRRGTRLITVDATVWQHSENKPAARGSFLFSNER